MGEIQDNGPTAADFVAQQVRDQRDEMTLKLADVEAQLRAHQAHVKSVEADRDRYWSEREAALEEAKALKVRVAELTFPVDAPVAIVGDPGWIPAAPPPSRQTTTELVATLQRRYPEDAEVRALIGKVTAAVAEVTTATERSSKAFGEVEGLRATVGFYERELAEVSTALSEAAGPEGAGPGLDGLSCRTMAEKARAALADEDE